MPAQNIDSGTLLSDLLRGIAAAPDIAVTGCASDSSSVAPGYVFLACAGISSHGIDYLDQALDNGACAVIWDATTTSQPTQRDDVAMVAVDNLAAHVGTIASRFYGEPSTALRVVGVTGTNGKTTVAWMVAAALRELGETCGYIGTLGYGVDDLTGTDGMTTPAAVNTHEYLASFVACGATFAAIEVSSHALAQRRVDGVRFDAALFTNLTRDHLDYHSDMQAYFDTKAKLFLATGAADKIIGVDDSYGEQLAALCGADAVIVSTDEARETDTGRHVIVRSIVATEKGSEVAFTSSWGDGAFSIGMPGSFNVANAMLTLGYLLSKEFSLQQSCDALAAIAAPPGRMQRVALRAPAVYVDYAHTPDALQQALLALRPHCRNRLWCVFGCGGDRDTGKRSQMGRIAAQYADEMVLTNDNPRTEAPQAIINDIVSGLAARTDVTAIEDRAAAIAWVIQQAEATDVVLIAGKGHETYQQIGTERRPFSDVAMARAALRAAGGQG